MKACAMCGWRMMEERPWSVHVERLHVCPNNIGWNSDVDSWTESKESSVGTSSDEYV